MPLSPDDLRAIVDELTTLLLGAPVQKARAEGQGCALELRKPGRSVWIQLSAQPGGEHLGVSLERANAAGPPTGFQKWLRQEVVGGRLVGVGALASEAVALDFERAGRPARRLVLELLGKKSRLVLLNDQEKVLAGVGFEVPDAGEPYTRMSTPARAARGFPKLEPLPGAQFPLAEAAHRAHADT